MDDNPAEQAINELFPYFEALETRSMAILQLLKDKGLITDEEFVPYLEQAANGSNVKWLAARIRVERLLSFARKEKEEEEEETRKTEETRAEPAPEEKAAETSSEKSTEKSEAKSTQPETGDRADRTTGKTRRNHAEKDADKPDKESTQKVSVTDGGNS